MQMIQNTYKHYVACFYYRVDRSRKEMLTVQLHIIFISDKIPHFLPFYMYFKCGSSQSCSSEAVTVVTYAWFSGILACLGRRLISPQIPKQADKTTTKMQNVKSYPQKISK